MQPVHRELVTEGLLKSAFYSMASFAPSGAWQKMQVVYIVMPT